MRVPVALANLDEADAGLDEAAGHEALPAEIVGDAGADAVHLAGLLRFAAHVHQTGHHVLHAEGQFVGIDDAFEFVVDLLSLQQVRVERLQQVQLLALHRFVDQAVGQIADAGLVDRRALLADAGGLVRGREEGVGVILRAAQVARRADGDEAGQVLIFGAQAVEQPGADAGASEAELAGVQHEARLRVVRHVGVHAVDKAHVVGMLGDFREQLGDVDAAAARRTKFKWRTQQAPLPASRRTASACSRRCRRGSGRRTCTT